MMFAETSQKLCRIQECIHQEQIGAAPQLRIFLPQGQYLETSMTPRLYTRLLSCRPHMFQIRGTAYSTVPYPHVAWRRHESKYCSLHSRLFCDYDQCETTACARARHERYPRLNGSSDEHDLEHAEAQLNRELERCRPVLQACSVRCLSSLPQIGELVRLVSTRPVKLPTQDALVTLLTVGRRSSLSTTQNFWGVLRAHLA